MDTDEQAGAAAPTSGEADVNMQDAKGTADSDASGVENGLPESGDKPVQMETDTKVSCCFKLQVFILLTIYVGGLFTIPKNILQCWLL